MINNLRADVYAFAMYISRIPMYSIYAKILFQPIEKYLIKSKINLVSKYTLYISTKKIIFI